MRTQNFMLVIMLLLVGGQIWGQDTIVTPGPIINKGLFTKNIISISDSGALKLQLSEIIQETDNIIIINPFGKNIYPKKYYKGSTVKFKINNVNFLRVHSSKVESKGVNYVFERANDLQQELESLIKKEKTLNSPGTDDQPFTTNENFLSFYKAFLEAFSSIESAINLEKELKNLVGDEVFIKDTEGIKDQADNMYDLIYGNTRDINEKISLLKQSFAELKDVYHQFDEKIEPTVATNFSGELKADNGAKVTIVDAKITQTVQNKYSEEFEAAKKTMAIFDNDAKTKEIIQKAEAGKELYYKIRRNDFVHYTDAIQLKDDFVTLTPRLKDEKEKVIHEFEPFTVRTRGGIKVNLSTGYLLNFIGSEEFDYRRDTAGNIKGVSSIGKDKLTHAVGVLAHVFWDRGKYTQWGISSGLSLNTEAKVNFHFGASAGFIEANRLIFTVGFSLVNLPQLNRSNLDKNDDFISSQHTEINYVSRYGCTGFIGITYNLINKK